MTERSESHSEDAAPRKRPGGRSARIATAVLEATREILAEGGFAALTIDEVADRAGVHKTTIYRRWESREGLVGAALADHSEAEVPIPDTGSLRGDLVALAGSVAANLASPLGRAIAQTMVGHADVPEIARITAEFWSARFARTAEIVERGIDRGELPGDTDPRLLVEMVVAPVWFRSIANRASVDDRLIGKVVEVALGGSAAGELALGAGAEKVEEAGLRSSEVGIPTSR